MLEYDSKSSLISLHIPKSGGTSFDNVLKEWFGLGFHRHYYNHIKEQPPHKVRLGTALQKIVPLCIHGHFDAEIDKGDVFQYYPDAKQFISIYRNPLELQLSYYFYQQKLIKEGASFWAGKKMETGSFLGKDIDEHLEEKSAYNWLGRFIPWDLTLENYKQVIDKNFIHIGITEDLQQSVTIFAEKLNKKPIHISIENTAFRTERPSESSIKKFKEKHALEYAFYEYVCLLNKK